MYFTVLVTMSVARICDLLKDKATFINVDHLNL